MTDSKPMTPEELSRELSFCCNGYDWESHEAADLITQYTAAIRQAALEEAARWCVERDCESKDGLDYAEEIQNLKSQPPKETR